MVTEAQRRLRGSGYSALWDVTCDVDGECLRLFGHLPSYYLKQMAQAIIAELAGVRQVINLIEVTASPDRPSLGNEWPTRANGHKPQT